MSDPAVCSFITKVLCSNGGRLEYSKIPEHVGLSEQQLEQILQDVGHERFLVHQELGGRWVIAVSPLRLCVRKECAGCERLHFCKLNLMGKCNFGVRACKYSHDIFTDGNRKVLKTHEVSGLNENELRVLLLQNDPFLLPDVCQFYNKGRGPHGTCSQQDNCNKLHVCRHFLRGECRFSKCNRSHRIMDNNVLKLLLAEGLNICVAKNIQVICDCKHIEFSTDVSRRRMPPLHDRPTPGGDKKKANAGNPEEIEPKPTSITPASTSHEPTPPGVKAVPSINVSGTSGIKKCDEICLYYIWRYCKHKDDCRMIHYHLPYRWQRFDGVNWLDLPRMEVVEKAYCDPKNDSVADQNINFRSITSSSALLRRLSTPSSVTKPSKFIMTTKWIWYWKNDLGQWIEYGKQDFSLRERSGWMVVNEGDGLQGASALASDDLENLFLANPNDLLQFQAGAQQYEINFKEMVQKNVRYQTQREVRRRPKFVSSEDVKKMRKGQRVTDPPDQNYPRNWDKSALPDVGYKAVAITNPSSEYTEIETLFKRTMNNYVIQRIRRIQNPSLWQVFQWQKEQMKKKNGGKDVDEKLLFHGTNSSHLEAICNHNFDWRICGVHGTNYGKGSYFARDAKYAHCYSQSPAKRNTMFVARVLVGDFVRGDPTYVRPPQKAADMLTFYDCCVDNVLVPSIFVVFEKHQIYPEYIIDYSEEEKKCFVS
ncbi:protein mono-ADP-ribosyltransferase PARP12-like isoform X1 [Malaclemys terrapin pileata]|uniref:protein mono-ADP-ribosyltransferase PARP12-like isoform X1 n=2 Tax=Malaclemys terrapin pileata TaxID=2991368 RepID=UPI0023A87929|nr:protein mono-ADP-ribosyltransferase PARP12-like isoform X1 [Malaclemys terrapin pileata]